MLKKTILQTSRRPRLNKGIDMFVVVLPIALTVMNIGLMFIYVLQDNGTNNGTKR